MGDSIQSRQRIGYNIVNFNDSPDYNHFQTQNRAELSVKKQEMKEKRLHPENLQNIKSRVSKEQHLLSLKKERLGNSYRPQFTNDIINQREQQQKTVPQNNLLNSMSQNYNVINDTTQQGMMNQPDLKQTNNQMAYKKKSIAEFSDLTRLNCPNFNPQHQHQLSQNQTVFRKTKAYCNQRCENAKLYGLSKPFRTYKYTNN